MTLLPTSTYVTLSFFLLFWFIKDDAESVVRVRVKVGSAWEFCYTRRIVTRLVLLLLQHLPSQLQLRKGANLLGHRKISENLLTTASNYHDTQIARYLLYASTSASTSVSQAAHYLLSLAVRKLQHLPGKHLETGELSAEVWVATVTPRHIVHVDQLLHQSVCRLDPSPAGAELAPYGLVLEQWLSECLPLLSIAVCIFDTDACEPQTRAGQPEPLVVEICNAASSAHCLFSTYHQLEGRYSLDMMISKPRFSSPKRFSTGTSTSSNSMYVDPGIY
jgi:hypothetical protein